jgi:hypothetical protein
MCEKGGQMISLGGAFPASQKARPKPKAVTSTPEAEPAPHSAGSVDQCHVWDSLCRLQ